MALVVKDRVKETTTTTGTGTVTLAGAVTGFQTFTAVLSDGDTTYYCIVHRDTAEFEVGLGTFTASGTTLARTTVLESSNSGSLVSFTSGTKDVFITYPAEKSVYLDASDVLSVGNISTTGYLRGPSTFTIDPATHGDNTGTLVIAGNLQVDGTTTTVNSTDMTVDDLNITVASGAANAAAADGAGLTIDGASATFTYVAIGDKFAFNKPIDVTGNIIVSGTVDGRDVATDGTKLDGIEASADVTDTANVTAAGALMDSEVTNLAQVKAFDSADYATAAQGTTADNALPKAGGTMTGNIVMSGAQTVDGRDLSVDGTKLDGIATSATANPNAIDNVVEDLTPQLGGDLASNGNDILFADNDKAIFGTGSDLQIFHDGTNSYIKDAGTGVITIQSNQIRIQNAAGTEDVAFFNQDGDVKLYYDSSVKLATTTTGISITGSIDVTDAATTRTNIDVDQAGTALALAIALG